MSESGYDDYLKHLKDIGESSEIEYHENEVKRKDVVIKVEDMGFKMVWVEGGTFMMGATSEQEGVASDEEKPAHSVQVDGFYIGETVVDQALWKKVMGYNPSHFKGDRLPVERVSWYDVQEFIRKLNKMTHCTFRLPREAEWEYAARGGDKSWGVKYSGGNDIGAVAWYIVNSRFKTHPVGQKRISELGLYDMSGNVLEWCEDWYGAYPADPQFNPKGPSTGTCRVVRGGSCISFSKFCRVSHRNYIKPNCRNFRIGFRLLLTQESASVQ